MQDGFSNYAQRIADLRQDGKRKNKLFGLCVHTSGSGVVKKAKAKGISPDEIALDYYDSAKYSTHYVAGHRGYYQLTDVMEQVSHVGYTDGVGGRMSGSQRRAWYHSGKWAEALPTFAKRFRKIHPSASSPSALHPSPFPSMDYAAIELIPCTMGYGDALGPGYKYSLAQHTAVALIALELAEEYGWPDDFEMGGRLSCHEELGPHARIGSYANPRDGDCWDPGRYRETPWISWETIQQWIRMGRRMGVEALAGFVETLYATEAVDEPA